MLEHNTHTQQNWIKFSYYIVLLPEIIQVIVHVYMYM